VKAQAVRPACTSPRSQAERLSLLTNEHSPLGVVRPGSAIASDNSETLRQIAFKATPSRNVQFTSTAIGAVPLAGSELIRKRLPSAETAY
jgi:hypothetical protein